MNEHNTKALYFCHTHPNLFLQKKCKGCHRGMCHTCINNHNDYCQSCLKSFFKGSSLHQNQKQVLRMFVSGIFLSLIVFGYQMLKLQPIKVNYLILGFCLGVSLMSMYYIMRQTNIYAEVSKVPFIGGKLAIVLLILTTVSGGPFLYFIYKLFLVGKSNYSKSVR